MTRRELLLAGAATAAACSGSRGRAPSPSATPQQSLPTTPSSDVPPATDVCLRRIPSSGELVPAIGLGSWQTFDVADDRIAAVQPVVDRFLALGGRVIDSSPMYGRAERAIGRMLAGRGDAPRAFVATKVWTTGQHKGVAQMRRSLDLLGQRPLDLMQVHNLVDWKTHLPILREWKQAGTIRYVGVTHYQHSAFAELQRIVEHESVDFVQLPYSVVDRAAEERLLPAAKAHGVAVLVMQPFASGRVFARLRGEPLPDFAAAIGCASWAQLMLKFLLGHDAVTCPIPATSKVAHVEDNLAAMHGPLPDQELRDRIARAFA